MIHEWPQIFTIWPNFELDGIVHDPPANFYSDFGQFSRGPGGKSGEEAIESVAIPP